MLIIFSGLPGVGKSSIARHLAGDIGAVYLRVDSIEQAILDSGVTKSLEDAGYRAAYAVATDNLRLGRTVVADSVNPLALTRRAWRAAAQQAGSISVDVEVICSDANEHRLRVESRACDIVGLVQPTWREVMDRPYEAWDTAPLVIDTSGQSVRASVGQLRAAIAGRQAGATA
jgi:predicted kinase